MRYFRIIFFSLALVMAASPAMAASASLGLAGNYNVFVFNSFTGTASDVQGRFASGGSASFYGGYSVGESISDNFSSDALTVGGAMTYERGEIYNGNARVAGAVGGAPNVVNGSLYSGATVPIDFSAERNSYKSLSNSLAALQASGTVNNAWGGLQLTGNSSTNTQIFNLNGSALDKTTGNWGLGTLLTDIGSDDTLIFNVSGESVTFSIDEKNYLSAYSGRILFNFYEAASLELTSAIYGSVLAPLADVTSTDGAGQMSGTLIAESFSGGKQFNLDTFTGDIPQTPIPGSLFLLGTGVLGLLGWRKQRR